MTYHRGQIFFQQYWDYEFNSSDNKNIEEDYYIDEFARIMEEAVRKRARNNLCLPVSGGMDSRTLAGMLEKTTKENGSFIKTDTIGYDRCYDIKFGRKVAQKLEFDHTVIPLGSNYIAKYIKEGILGLEGGAACHTFWIFAQAEFLVKNHLDFIMDGFLGDALSGAHLPKALIDNISEEQAIKYSYQHYYNKIFKQEELAKLLKPTVYNNIKYETVDSIRASFKKANADNILNKFDYVDLHQRQRRYISLHHEVLGYHSHVLDPFTDNEFVDLILCTPPRLRLGQRIYKKMFLRHLPELAGIPLSKNGLPITAIVAKDGIFCLWNPSYSWNFFYSKLLPRFTSNKFGHDLTSFVHLNEALRNGSSSLVNDVLDRKELLEDYFNIDAVNNLIKEYMVGNNHNGTRISALITFSRFREQFF